MRQYWFKPKQFFKWFAAYYPVTWQGWIVTFATALVLLAVIARADIASHSVSDTLIGAAFPVIVALLLFDIISFRTGEYPHWWKKKE